MRPSLTVALQATLPSDFALPGLGVLAILGVLTAVVAIELLRRRPLLDQRTALAFAPWMVADAAARVLHGLGGIPASIDPFFGTPAVYASGFVLAGGSWTLLERAEATDVAQGLAVIGGLAALPSVIAVLRHGILGDSLAVIWPGVAILAALALTGLLAAWDRRPRSTPGLLSQPIGLLVVFGHALDGTSTAVGVDVFDAVERTPLPRFILEFSETLPTADLVGTGWLFVVVKLGVAVFVVHVLRDLVVAEPQRGYLLLTAVAAVGLGPGVHNVLLFAVTGG